MGTFNTLHTNIICENCGRQYPTRIQFSYGNTWLLDYKIGDKITWGGNDTGIPDLPKVKAYGSVESTLCPFCNYESPNDQYDVIIEHDVIKSVQVAESLDDYNEGGGEYKVL